MVPGRHKLLLELDDSQIEMCLLRGCLAVCKVNYFLRTIPPEDIPDSLDMLKDTLAKTVAQIARSACLSPLEWKQASLPTKLGGLGISDPEDIAPAAFVGSWLLVEELVSGGRPSRAGAFTRTVESKDRSGHRHKSFQVQSRGEREGEREIEASENPDRGSSRG